MQWPAEELIVYPAVVVNRFIAALALAGFGVAVVVHIQAWLGVPPLVDSADVFWVHAGVFGVVLLFVANFALARRLGRPLESDWNAALPRWARIALYACFFYVAGVMMFFFLFTETPVAQIRDGKKGVLFVDQAQHRKLFRESDEEYEKATTLSTRTASAVWMIFYLSIGLYAAFARPEPSGPACADPAPEFLK